MLLGRNAIICSIFPLTRRKGKENLADVAGIELAGGEQIGPNSIQFWLNDFLMKTFSNKRLFIVPFEEFNTSCRNF